MSINYADLRWNKHMDEVERKRCAARLLSMRETLASSIKRKKDSSLLLATWNIRDFDSNKYKFGPRLEESFYYIAEIISHFDLVALQEINRDLRAFDKLMHILGREWDYIVTDTTEGSGNNERMAFVYNTDKVFFRKIAGEVVLPDGQMVVTKEKVKPDQKQPDIEPQTKEMEQQFARSPFLVAFQSGWFRFSLCTVHIYYGASSGKALNRRIREIENLVEFFAERQDKASKQELDRSGAVENYILLGDFNVVSPEHKTMQALESNGFTVPEPIQGDKVREKGQHFYDQIAVRVKDERFNVVSGGMVDIYKDVFRANDEDRAIYASKVPQKDPEPDEEYQAKTSEALFKKWRTWQMSDHYPLWIEIDTDFSTHYLKKIAGL